MDQDDAYLYAEDGGDLAENEEACSVPEGPLINQVSELFPCKESFHPSWYSGLIPLVLQT